MVFESLGKEPKIVSVPEWVFTAVIHLTWFIGLIFKRVAVFSGFLKVIRYYSLNEMRAAGYGSITLRQHVKDTVRELQTQQPHGQ